MAAQSGQCWQALGDQEELLRDNFRVDDTLRISLMAEGLLQSIWANGYDHSAASASEIKPYGELDDARIVARGNDATKVSGVENTA